MARPPSAAARGRLREGRGQHRVARAVPGAQLPPRPRGSRQGGDDHHQGSSSSSISSSSSSSSSSSTS
eukprot:13962298-Heterocapsa_arctica.AAC.1